MIIDTNTYISRWPFRRLVGDETPDFVARLRKRNVAQAWAGSFDGILHKDIGGVNARLAADCRTHGKRLPGAFRIDQSQASRAGRRICGDARKSTKCPAYACIPTTMGTASRIRYSRSSCTLAAARRLIVQLVISMEDVRTQHPLMRVPPVDVSALPQVIKSEPSVRLMLLNWAPALGGQPLQPLADAGAVYFDISTVEGIEGIARLVERLPSERILFGSHYPLFYFEAALLKMQESGLPEEQKQALFEGNARRLLARTAA